MWNAVQNVDAAVLLWIQDTVRNAVITPLACFYTKLGDMGMLWLVLSLFLLCFRPTRRAGCMSLLAMALGMICTNVVLKHLVARPRPWLDVTGLIPLVAEHDPNSFPSGHTCAAFAAASAWFKTLPQKWMRILVLILAALMGLSRLYVGVHYPSDVLAGALIGMFCGWCALKIEEELFTKR